jgi:hypothetical protein
MKPSQQNQALSVDGQSGSNFQLLLTGLSGSLFCPPYVLVPFNSGPMWYPAIERKEWDWTEITPKSSLRTDKKDMRGASLCLRVVVKGRPAALLYLHILASSRHLLAGYRTNQAPP